MKKLFYFLLLACFGSAIHAHGENYKYLSFYTNESDTPAAIGCEGLTISIAENTLTAIAGNESVAFPLNSLTAMEFSNTGSNSVDFIFSEGRVFSLYSLDGVKIEEFKSLNEIETSVNPGVYVIKTDSGKSIKILIGK